MKRHIERLRRATWTYKQPLTRVPAIAGAPVSDLFVWRNSEEWETFFELTDLPALFAGPDSAGRNVTLVFFDAAGYSFFEKTVEITPKRRNTLPLSAIIGIVHGAAGTFSVFHTHTPQSLRAPGFTPDRARLRELPLSRRPTAGLCARQFGCDCPFA